MAHVTEKCNTSSLHVSTINSFPGRLSASLPSQAGRESSSARMCAGLPEETAEHFLQKNPPSVLVSQMPRLEFHSRLLFAKRSSVPFGNLDFMLS